MEEAIARVPDRRGGRRRGRRPARAGAVPVRGRSAPTSRRVNAMPRIVLGSLFIITSGLGMSSKVVARRVPGVLRGVLQRLPGRPRGGRQPAQQRADPGRVAAAMIRNVVIPSALTWIIASACTSRSGSRSSARSSASSSARSRASGVVIADAQNNFNADGVFAAMIIIGAIALVAEWLISLLERRLLSWRPQIAVRGRRRSERACPAPRLHSLVYSHSPTDTTGVAPMSRIVPSRRALAAAASRPLAAAPGGLQQLVGSSTASGSATAVQLRAPACPPSR